MTNQKENWEEEFDKKFLGGVFSVYAYQDQGGDYSLTEKVKSFIRQNFISKKRVEEAVKKKKPARDEQMSFKLGYNQALYDLLSALKFSENEL